MSQIFAYIEPIIDYVKPVKVFAVLLISRETKISKYNLDLHNNFEEYDIPIKCLDLRSNQTIQVIMDVSCWILPKSLDITREFILRMANKWEYYNNNVNRIDLDVDDLYLSYSNATL